MKFHLHPAQKKFFEDDRPRVLYGGGQPSKGYFNKIMSNLMKVEGRMTGQIKMINFERSFGFIKGSNGTEYFFHKSGFTGYWKDLRADYEVFDKGLRDPIEVEFESVDSNKGPRAEKIIRTDNGVE